MLILAPVVVCQAALSSSPAPTDPVPVTAGACNGSGHDVLCTRGIAAAAAPSTRGGRDDAMRDGFGPLIALVVIGAAFPAGGAGLVARFRAISGLPTWASQQLVPGRHQLVAIGISRI
jgi:hypothetical protein